MHEKVKAFLDSKQEETRKYYEKEKQETLIELGLYDIEFSPNNEDSPEYPHTVWDQKNFIYKYYKRIPVEVSDEEYQTLKNYSKKAHTTTQSSVRNPVASALTAIAWFLFIAGFIVGIILGTETEIVGTYYQYEETTFSFAAALTYWGISLVSGIMFLGFAEIIKLLEAIKRK